MSAFIEPTALDVESSQATGDAVVVRQLTEVRVHVTGTFVATLDIQVSHDDGATYATAQTATAAGIVSVPEANGATHLRVDTSAYTSGTAAARLAGRDLALAPPNHNRTPAQKTT